MSIDLPAEEQVSDTSTTAISPLPWWLAWKRALFQPSVKTFQELANDPNATTRRAFTWLFISELIFLILLAEIFDPWSVSLEEFSRWTILAVNLLVTPFRVATLMIVVGISHWIARILGGTGYYKQLAFVLPPFTPLSF